MAQLDIQKRIQASYKLLLSDSITKDTFLQIKTLVKGINTPLDNFARALSDFEKLSNDEIIELTAENLPEETDEQKKRKKALLFLIQNWKQLQSEVSRVETEMKNENNQTKQKEVRSFGRILAKAKGPFGIITILAVVIAGFLIFTNPQTPTAVTNTQKKTASMKIIQYNNKQIPLDQLYIGRGPDCDSPHYHATKGQVITTDRTVIQDPEQCGFGKLKDVQVIEITVTKNP